MPKIYEYLGIAIYFFANEHEPIHVHGKYGEFESKAEFDISNGKIVKITVKKIKKKRPLKGKILRDFEIFVNEYGEEIVEKWNLFFSGKADFNCEKITKRI